MEEHSDTLPVEELKLLNVKRPDPTDNLDELHQKSYKRPPKWLRVQLFDTEGATPGRPVKAYPGRPHAVRLGINLRAAILGGPIYRHLSLEANVKIISGNDDTGYRFETDHECVAKIFMDNRHGISHIANYKELGITRSPVKDGVGAINVEFTLQHPATTEKCDVRKDDWPSEVMDSIRTLELLQALGSKAGRKVKLALWFYNTADEQAAKNMLVEFQKSYSVILFPYLSLKEETAMITVESAKSRQQVQKTRLPDGSSYQPEKFPKVDAFRDTLELAVRLGYGNILEEIYQRSLFIPLERYCHEAQFLIKSDSIIVVCVKLNENVSVEEVPFDECTILQLSWFPPDVAQKKEDTCTTIPIDIACSSAGRGTLTLLCLSSDPSDDKFQHVASASQAQAPCVTVKIMAQFNENLFSTSQQCLSNFCCKKDFKHWYPAFLNNASASGKCSDPASYSNLNGYEIDNIFDSIMERLELNEGQKNALRGCRSLSNLFHHIFGPPGTGKTWTLCAYATFLTMIGMKVVLVAPSNAAVNKLRQTAQDQADKMGILDKTFSPVMINRQTAEIAYRRNFGSENRCKSNIDKTVQVLGKSKEEFGAAFAVELEDYVAVKQRYQKKAMESPGSSLTNAVIEKAYEAGSSVKVLPPTAEKGDPEVDQIPILKFFLEKLKKESYSKWSESEKDGFNRSYDNVQQYILGMQKILACTPATMALPVINGFATGQDDKVVLILDENAMQSMIDTVKCIAGPGWSSKIVGVVSGGDMLQLDHLVLSKDVNVNEFAADLAASHFERRMAVGAPSTMLTMSIRLHPALVDLPSTKMYDGKLFSSHVAMERKLNPEYAAVLSGYLQEENTEKLRLYAISMPNSECKKSETSKSKTNLVSATEIGNLSMLIRTQVNPESFNFAKEVVILTSYKEQVKTINRVFAALIQKFNDTRTETTPELKRSELPEVYTIDGFQGQDASYCWWDTVVSHATTSKSIGFLRQNNRVNVACTRGKQQLLLFCRLDLLREEYSTFHLGKEFDVRTSEWVTKPIPLFNEYLLECVREDSLVVKTPTVT